MEGGKIYYENLENKNKESIITDNSNDKMLDQDVELDYEI